MKLNHLDLELTARELTSLAVRLQPAGRFELERISFAPGTIAVLGKLDMKIPMAGRQSLVFDSVWVPERADGALRLTLRDLKGGMFPAGIMKRMAVAAIAEAAGAGRALVADGESLTLDPNLLLRQFGIPGDFKLEEITCGRDKLHLTLSGSTDLSALPLSLPRHKK